MTDHQPRAAGGHDGIGPPPCQRLAPVRVLSETDFDVFDGDRDVGRIFRQADGAWFWGVSFQLTARKSFGNAASLDEAKAAFRAEYERWKSQPGGRFY
jgi:hypothetical protein